MNPRNSAKIVEDFWTAVWKARNPGTVADFVVDDFVITTGGVDIESRQKFKQWASAFMEKINDLKFEVLETFQNADGSRVASRWRITGKNNGLLAPWPIKGRFHSRARRSGPWAKMKSSTITGSNAALMSCFSS
jgi:hypothetical protein